MRTSLGGVVCVGLVVALVALVHPPAFASWYVSDVTYTYGWDAAVNQDVYYPGTPVVMGHIWRTGSNSYYYAKAEAYGIGAEYDAVAKTDPRDAQGRPLLGHSNLNARLWLEGAPPPQRPSTWPQKSYLDGKHCITFTEVQGPAGLDWASGLSMTGLMGYNPPTQGYTYARSWEPEDGVRRQYVDQRYLIDLNWVSRTTQNQYRAAWVYAGATAGVKGVGGKVRSEVSTCALSWGILHNP